MCLKHKLAIRTQYPGSKDQAQIYLHRRLLLLEKGPNSAKELDTEAQDIETSTKREGALIFSVSPSILATH